MTNDLTKGNPLTNILRMSLPIMAGNLFQQFYTMTDTIIVGRLLGRNALAAVGSTASIYNLVFWFANGAAGGYAIILAQDFGAKRYGDLKKSLAHSIMLSAVTSLLVTCFSLLFIRQTLQLMHTPEEIYPDAVRYIVTILAGLTATIAYNMASAIFRAIGNSRTPLLFLIFSSILNIALDLLFIGPMGWGTRGAASATVLAQVVSVLLCILHMKRRYSILHMKRSDWHFLPQKASKMLRLGLPLGLMGVMTASGIIILQVAINSFGAASVAAYTAANKVETLFTFPLAAYGITMTNFCGQNYGAGKYGNIRKGIRQCFLLMAATSLVFVLILEAAGPFLSGLFLSSADTEVISMTSGYLRVIALFLPCFGALMILRNSVQGLGFGGIPTLNGILETICRVLWTLWLIPHGSFRHLSYVDPTAWSLAVLMMVFIYFFRIRKLLLVDKQ